MTSYRFSVKKFFTDSFEIGDSLLLLTSQWRLHIHPQALASVFSLNIDLHYESIFTFERLLLWQFCFVGYEFVNNTSDSIFYLFLHPFGYQPDLIDEGFFFVCSYSGIVDFSIYSCSSVTGSELDIPKILNQIHCDPVVARMFSDSSSSLVSSLLKLSSTNRLAFLTKYLFCRAPEFREIVEKPTSTQFFSPNLVNPSPSLRSGPVALLSSAMELVRYVFKKSNRGVIAVDPPISTFHRRTPSPGGLTSCEVFILHASTNVSPTQLYFYDSLLDTFELCLGQHSAESLDSFSSFAFRDSALNYSGGIDFGTLIILASDLWILERKYGSGAFSLACLEAGVVSESIHSNLSSMGLGGCMCGSMQIWPLLAFANPSRTLLPLLGYALFQLIP